MTTWRGPIHCTVEIRQAPTPEEALEGARQAVYEQTGAHHANLIRAEIEKHPHTGNAYIATATFEIRPAEKVAP